LWSKTIGERKTVIEILQKGSRRIVIPQQGRRRKVVIMNPTTSTRVDALATTPILTLMTLIGEFRPTQIHFR